jgi:hypothetical protein
VAEEVFMKILSVQDLLNLRSGIVETVLSTIDLKIIGAKNPTTTNWLLDGPIAEQED